MFKEFCEVKREAVNGYPVYMRCDNDRTVDVRGGTLNNRYIVAYNALLLAKFNVEVCTTENTYISMCKKDMIVQALN